MQTYKQILIYGFAIFAMFFGSGNLVFPLQIGQQTGAYWMLGFLGLFFTGILLPFLGLFVIKLHRGSYYAFFDEAGLIARLAVPFFALSLLGAFGVVPRCIAVAHGGIGYIFPHLSLTVFSTVFCLICFFICLKDQLIIHVLGKWMTPILLLGLVALITLGVLHAPPTNELKQSTNDAFTTGFLVGYQTMDLFAAFFFSSLIFLQIQKEMPEGSTHKTVLYAALKPSIVGALLLAAIYLGFVFLGSHYASLTAHLTPELMLPAITSHIIGDKATLLIGVIVIFSCLTTAVALNNIYARYLSSLFKLSEKQFPMVLLGTTVTSFLVSLLDFRGIATFLAPILEVSYPSLIALTLMSIVTCHYKTVKKIIFYGLLIAMLGYRSMMFFLT